MTKVKNAHSEFAKKDAKPITSDQVFELFQSSIVLSGINAYNQDLYRVLTQESASLKTPSVLASRAATLETQGCFKSQDAFYAHNRPKGNSGSQNKNRKPYQGKNNGKGDQGSKDQFSRNQNQGQKNQNKGNKGTGKHEPGKKPDSSKGRFQKDQKSGYRNYAMFAAKDWNIPDSEESSDESKN